MNKQTAWQILAFTGWAAALMVFVQIHRFNGAIMDEMYTVEAQCGIGPAAP